MRIAIYLPWAYPLFNQKETEISFGGSEVRLVQLGKALSEFEGMEVTFVCYTSFETMLENYDSFKVYRVNKHERWKSKSDDVKISPLRFFRKRSHIYSLMKGIDAEVYFQICASEETGWIARFCREHRRKFAYFVASDIDVTGEYERKSPIGGYLYRRGLKEASLIIAQNEEQQEILLKRLGLDSVVLKNPVEIPRDVPSFGGRTKILWVGRGDVVKHPEIFLWLARKLPKYNFTMVMPRSSNYPDLFDRIQQQASTIENVNFVEFVPRNRISAYYERARVFISTSDYEGFPNTFLEAGRWGTPIVSLNVDPDGFIKKHGCGMVCKGNINKLSICVEELMKDENTWRGMSLRIYDYVRRHHSVDYIVTRLSWILNEQ